MAGCGKVGDAAMAKGQKSPKAKEDKSLKAKEDKSLKAKEDKSLKAKAEKPQKAKKKKGMMLSEKKNMAGYVFILPVVIGMIFIFLPALVNSLIYAFNNVTIGMGGVNMEPVGIQNFKDAFFTDANFIPVFISGIRGMFFDSAVIILFSFFMSNVLNQKFKGRGICRVIFFLPVVLSVGIVAEMEDANEMFNAMNGSLEEASATGTFDQIGLSTLFNVAGLLQLMEVAASMTNMIGSVLTNMYGILNASGVQILIFLSALQSISPSVFEAAKMEGATKWEEFWKITFPMLTPSLLVCVVYTVISTFTNPVYGIMDYIQAQGFSGAKYGYASALSWIYFVVVIVVLGLATGIISKRVTYLD